MDIALDSKYCSRSQIRILRVAEFLLIRGFFYFFSFHLIELFFGRVLAEQKSHHNGTILKGEDTSYSACILKVSPK